MKNNLMKTTCFLILVLCFSKMYGDYSNTTNDCSTQPVQEIDSKPAIINLPSRVDTCGRYDVFASASFIYWQAKETQLTVADENTTTNLVNKREAVRYNFKYKPGFKVGLGYNFSKNDWQLYSEYIRLTSSTKKQAATIGNFIQYWYVTGDVTVYSIKSTWNLDYNSITLSLGKPMYISEKLIFKPSFGLKGAFIDQGAKTTLFSVPRPRTDIIASTHSWLFGPYLQTDFNWILANKFRLFLNTKASLFYQKFTKVRLDDSSFNDPTKEKHFIDNNSGQINPYAATNLGLAWGRYFSNNNYHFDLSLGYDIEYYWNQNMIKNIIAQNYNQSASVPMNGNESKGDLFLHGLTVSAQLDF